MVVIFLAGLFPLPFGFFLSVLLYKVVELAFITVFTSDAVV